MPPAQDGFQEEEALGKGYDARLMRRLLQYLRPYRRYVALAIAILVQGHEAIGAFFETIQSIGSGAPDQELKGFLAYGFVLVLIVAVAKIIVETNRN